MNTPTEADWAHSPDDLDAASAYKSFHGKTLDEAFALFVDNALGYQEDIMFMPAPCFYFYVDAYIDYLHSSKSSGDSDGASSFFGIVDVRREVISRGPRDLRERIRALLRRIGESQAWYEADVKIYGRFSEKADRCLRLIAESGGDNVSVDEEPKEWPVGLTFQQGHVIRVFSATQEGARFRAYQVKWLDQEVIVSDLLAITDFGVGDPIKFMSHISGTPGEGPRILQFHTSPVFQAIPEG